MIQKMEIKKRLNANTVIGSINNSCVVFNNDIALNKFTNDITNKYLVVTLVVGTNTGEYRVDNIQIEESI